MRRQLNFTLPFGLAMIAVACAGGQQSNSEDAAKARKARKPVEKRDASRFDDSDKEIQRFDLNNDEIPDVWKIFSKIGDGMEKSLVLVRKEIDVNFDGRVDVWQYFDGQGKIGKDEMDTDFDSRIDVVTYYDGGQVVRREVNAEFDGAADYYKYYDGGVLVRIERDTDNNGRIDTWEYFEGGALARVGRDQDGDGQAETWVRAGKN